MSGPENFRGIDYQVSYTVLRILELLVSAQSLDSIQIESLKEEEEDLNIRFSDGSMELVQIKKRMEGYNWTPSDLKPILENFLAKDSPKTTFTFVTDGTGNATVASLRRALLARNAPDKTALSALQTKVLTISVLQSLLPKVTLLTQYYPSPDEKDPALLLKEKVRNTLLTAPYSLGSSLDTSELSLWQYVFNLSKSPAWIRADNIVSELSKLKIKIAQPTWLQLPDLERFHGRAAELKAIHIARSQCSRIIVQGISGTGKTTLLARVAQELHQDGEKTCWISITPLLTPDELSRLMSSFISHHFDKDFTRTLDANSLQETVAKFATAMKQYDARILFDGLDRAPDNTRAYIESFFTETLKHELRGSIFLSSTTLPKCVSEIDIANGLVFKYTLTGYRLKDANALLEQHSVHLSPQEAKDLHKAVGGHPLTYEFLYQLFRKKDGKRDVSALMRMSTEQTRAHLFEGVFSSLSSEEQAALLAISVFDYPFSSAEAGVVIRQSGRHSYLLRHLLNKSLLSRSGTLYVLHDALRQLAYGMQSPRVRTALHDLCAKHYLAKIKLRHKKSVPAKLGLKWGRHVELATGRPSQIPGIVKLLKLTDDQLDALWAIDRFGHPFAFESTAADKIESTLEELSSQKLIVPAEPDPELPDIQMYRYMPKKSHEGLFLRYLCESRRISGQLGYIPRKEPNRSFDIQGLLCHWEHCIELCPIPPMTKADHAQHIEHLKAMFAKGGYDDKPPHVQAELMARIERGVPDDAPDMPDLEMEATACPLFGHCCPGGKEQVAQCTSEFNEAKESLVAKQTNKTSSSERNSP